MIKRRSIDSINTIVKKNTIDKEILIESSIFPIKTRMKNIGLQYMDATDGAFKIVEAKTYCRENFSTIEDGYDDAIHALSNKAFLIFKYIKNNILPNSNYIVLSPDIISNVINEQYKQNVYKYLKELITNNLIAKSPHAVNKFTYTINHNLFFKGNYNAFVNKYNKIYGDQSDNREDVNDR